MAGRDAAGVTVLAARLRSACFLAARFIRTASAPGAACSAGFALFAARFVGVRIAAAVWWIASATGPAAI